MVGMSAYESLAEKPLPAPPGLPASPTLTNPDMVLPDVGVTIHSLPSPPRSRGRPPSPSYLKDQTNEDRTTPSTMAAEKREKRGLMSRKMLLLRSRTGSAMSMRQQQEVPRGDPTIMDSRSPEDYDDAYASSPTLMDVGNLAPEQAMSAEEKRLSVSGSSFNSEEFAAIPAFLAKYDTNEGTTTGDESSDNENATGMKYGYSVSIQGGYDAQRRQREEDEHNSAILSKRAEQILANAKRRLNVMEGNLRGARDLVSPLTAANLKRATSLGSSAHPAYTPRGRFMPEGYRYETSIQPARMLHAQASSPTMGRDYSGHSRTLSGADLPDRPHTALGGRNSIMRSARIPVRPSGDASWTPGLRNSKSHDSIGIATTRDRPLRPRGSPESILEPLREDEDAQQVASRHQHQRSGDSDGLGIYVRPGSRTDDIKEQMTSLKGKISTLRERAREDSLRRQSLLNLRTPSPFNNAAATAPEFFYSPISSPVSPVLDTKAGATQKAPGNSAVTPSDQEPWQQPQTLPAGRNAFAEQFAQHRNGRATPEKTAQTRYSRRTSNDAKLQEHNTVHRRTPSGTAVVNSATNRYSHHQHNPSQGLVGTNAQIEPQQKSQSPAISPLAPEELTPPNSDPEAIDDDQISVYEDAEHDQPPVVAHEDRDDAFDYKHFFLHSAMGNYSNGRAGSTASEDTISSAETARAPATQQEELDNDAQFNPESGIYPPPTPETPERLREIERNLHLHRRNYSQESTSTMATFATADEGVASPPLSPHNPDWPMTSSTATSNNTRRHRPSSRRASRPTTALRRRDSSSERADSGVGLDRRSNGSRDRDRDLKNRRALASPPMSPNAMMLHDPVTLAVNALLDPQGRGLGLKEKALLFGVVEGLKKVVVNLQREGDGEGGVVGYEARVLRRRLDEARRALDGTLELRMGAS